MENEIENRIAIISVHGCPMMRAGVRSAGGMNIYLKHLVESLGQKDFYVDLFTRNHQPDGPAIIPLGPKSRVIHIPAGPELMPKEDIYYHLPEFLSNMRDFIEQEQSSYDLVHSHYWLSGWIGCDLAQMWEVPHVATYHTLSIFKRLTFEAQEPLVREKIERDIASKSHGIIGFSVEELQLLNSVYGVPTSNLHITTEGVDTRIFSPRDKLKSRSHLGIDSASQLILYVGRLEAFKGTHVLLRSIAKLQDIEEIKLLIVGGGGDEDPEAIALKHLALELGIAEQIIWQDAVVQEDLPDYYAASDLCAVPSYHESFGLVALEAMACAKPVVASSVGGLKSLVVDGVTGLLVEPNRPDEFAWKLRALLNDHKLRDRMSASAVLRAKTFTWSNAADEVSVIYERIIRNRETTPLLQT